MAPKAKTAKGSAAAVAEVPTTKLLNALKAELTEKDLADAKAALAKAEESSTEKRRMEANMFYYLKKSGEVPAGSSLRGDRRREYLVLWMAKTTKDKNAVVSIDTVHQVSSKTESNDGAEWMGLEQMRRIHGEERVNAWMESGKLIKAPCPVTGSLEDNLADFKVPKKTESKIGSEEFKHGSKSSKEGGSEAELLVHQATMADMAGNLVDQLTGLAGEGEGTEVKTEAEAADKESLENLAVFKNTKVLLRALRESVDEAKVLQGKAAGIEYAGALTEDFKSYTSKATSCLKALEKLRVVTDNTTIVPTEIQRLDKKVSEFTIKWTNIAKWAGKFGLRFSGGSKRPKTA